MSYKYKLIFFDADETLYDYKMCEQNAFFMTLQELSVLDTDKYPFIYDEYAKINADMWKKYHKGEIKKEQVLKNRFDILFSRWELELDVAMFGERYLEILSNQDFLIQNAECVLKQLSYHCKLAIITNGVSSVHRNRLQRSLLKPFISNIFISGDQGNDPDFQKPNSKIFKFAHLQTAPDIPIDQILMVGDALNSDIMGGINYNIDTCWFNAAHQVNQSHIVPTYEIDELQSLIKIITGAGSNENN